MAGCGGGGWRPCCCHAGRMSALGVITGEVGTDATHLTLAGGSDQLFADDAQGRLLDAVADAGDGFRVGLPGE